ncbi:MAG: S1 family peptidase [Nitrososphaera sp.]|nr:S1 family peptidase [Nitrososphaera sp.]
MRKPKWWAITLVALLVGAIGTTILLQGNGANAGTLSDLRLESSGSELPIDRNQILVRVAERTPGYGGHFIDREQQGVLKVFLTDPSQKDTVEDALAEIFGARLTQSRQIEVLPADYSIIQLKDWYDRVVPAVMVIPGVAMVDLEEDKNRIEIGLERADSEIQKIVEKSLAELNIPKEAVNITVRGRAEYSANLRNKERPIMGGLTIRRSGTSIDCSVGFNAIRSGTPGVITASHCTATNGAPADSSLFYQALPTDPTPNKLGTEVIDGTWSSKPGCPSGHTCRYADSAFLQKDSSAEVNQGHIARPGSIGSTTYSGTYRIVAEGIPSVGDELHKVGRATGLQKGDVVDTCVDWQAPLPNKTYLCQDVMESGTLDGDSGSSVFQITNSPTANDVELMGLVWGATSSGGVNQTLYAFINNVYDDLGVWPPWDVCASGFSC